MINHEEYIAYFEHLAIKHKEILHNPDGIGTDAFRHGDVEMLLDDIGGDMSSGYILLLETETGGLTGDDEDSAQDRADCAFVVCHPVEPKNRAQQIDVEQACKLIAFQILGKMKYDRRMGNTTLKNFDVLSVRYQRLYGLPQNRFGFRISFNVMDNAGVKHEPDVWND